MKLPLVILVVLMSFCAGGAGAYFFFKQPAVASTGDAAHEKIEESHSKKKDDGHGGESVASNVYYKLDPLILPVVNKYGLSQTISLVVVLEVENDKNREFVRVNAPRLTDAYIQDMYGVLNKHAALNKGAIHVSFLKKRLKHVTTKVVGEDKVLDVLIQVIEQRPL